MNWTIVLLIVAISLIKLGQGLDIDIKTRYFSKVNYWLLIRSVITVVFLIPILFLLLILILQPNLRIIALIAIIAVSPGAHSSIEKVNKLGGDVSLTAQVQMICALISIVTAPLLLKAFEFCLGLTLDISFPHLIFNIAESQFIPMGLGLILRQLIPSIKKLSKSIRVTSTTLLVGCFIVLIFQNYEFIMTFKLNAYLILILVTVSAFILGVVMAGKNAINQISLAIESSMRNPGLAYVIASTNFLKEQVNAAMLPYVIVSIATITLATSLLKLIQKKMEIQ